MSSKNITVRMSGLPYTFEAVISGSITLAANDGGTTLNLKLADVDRKIGNDLIKHSMATGGIQGIPQPDAPVANAISGTNVEASAVPLDPGKSHSYHASWETVKLLIVKECLKQGVTVPDAIAYVLATADGESGQAEDMIEVWDGKGLQATYDGRLGNTNPGDGYKYRGRGLAQMTGKERYEYWSKQLGVDLVANPDLMANLSTAIPVLVVGMRDGGFTGRKLGQYIDASHTDYQNARRVINGIVASQMPIYNNAFKRYQTQVQALIATAIANPLATTTAKPVDTTVKSALPVKTASNTITDVTPDTVVKGNMLFVEWYGVELTFFHTGTDMHNDGSTTITGQGLRWVMNRRKRTKALGGLKFSELAARVGKSHGIQVDYQAAFDPSFIVVEQTGISDYALLKREAGRAGLYISEKPGSILIQSLSQIKDTTILLQTGVNLLKWQVKDKAIDADATFDQPDSGLTTEVKGAIDPLTGKVIQKVPDVDPTKGSKDATGTTPAKAPVSGVLVPGQELKAIQQVQRFKRVKGLPSAFTVPTDETFLLLTPLSALRTKGISEYLDRVWLVNKVTHSTDGTTTIECFSPVEILDITPPAPQPGGNGAVSAIQDVNPGAFIVPCTGTITSLVGRRVAPRDGASTQHNGTDIANSEGTPVVAAQAGIVSFSGVYGKGGNAVKVEHKGGYQTVYMHLSQIQARLNATLNKGDAIGLMGSTGNVTGTHLHFEVRKDNGETVLTPDAYGLPSLLRLTNTVIQGSTT